MVVPGGGRQRLRRPSAPLGRCSISNQSIIKIWGTMHNFMPSYGLKPHNPEDFDEVDAIIVDAIVIENHCNSDEGRGLERDVAS